MKPLEPAIIHDPNNFRKYAPFTKKSETWMNDEYTVMVVRHQSSGFSIPGVGEPLLITWLSIKRNDRSAKPDWRAFQWIKNQLVGEECEAVELYPAESRLVDGANQYHLWVFEDPTFRFPFGFNSRMVTEKPMFGETQRKFPDNRRPKDLELWENWVQEHKRKIDSGELSADEIAR